MHQLLQTKGASGSSLTSGESHRQKSVQFNEIIALSSFEIVKYLRMHVIVYVILIMVEILYMLLTPAQKMILGKTVVTTMLFEQMTAPGVYLFSIAMTTLMVLQTLFILMRGRNLKLQQSQGNESGGADEGSIMYYLIKASGIFLVVMSTAMSQLFIRVIPENFSCDRDYEIEYGCESGLRTVAIYFSIAGIPLLIFLIVYTDFFLIKLFPNEHIPWSGWGESRLWRNLYKAVQVVAISLIYSPTYQIFINAGLLFIAYQIIEKRSIIPQLYNRTVHISMIILESQLAAFSLFAILVNIIEFKLDGTGLIFVGACGLFIAIFLTLYIDRKEHEILSIGSDLKNYESVFEMELYLVVMLHELERLTQSEDYAHEKHVHAIVGRHMEECKTEICPCKNYEPEYDKKFTSMYMSRRFTTKQFSVGFSSQGSSSYGKQMSSYQELKRLPYKINYKTKVEIFKKEFEDRTEVFLQEYPKAEGIKLLKSFFNHKYCDSSYKALFVQLENSISCKNAKGKVFIYHLKTQIQDEMKKSTESPLSIDINSLLRFEKFKMDFERNLEDLSFNCQTFWTDLTKDDYKVENALKIADQVADKIIKIKNLFTKIIDINPLCIDTSSTYALVYRHILRDEATFNDLVNRIQQIKNSSKLEQQREIGIRFFDSDIYALLMVSGELKELGRVKQANSSTRFVFGYDPRDLVGSRINKLMPAPFAQVHDKFMMRFLEQGKSNWLDRNQPLAVMTKEGFLQMTLFYIKPMVSLEFGLIFSCFGKKLSQYTLADETHELQRLHKLCVFITDCDGQIHGMTENCTKRLGIPTPAICQQLYINDNQMFNIGQICQNILQQDYEFDLIKGAKMNISTNFLKKERQFRREFPEIACKIGDYQGEIGIHKFQYRDLKCEINIYVLKLLEKDDYVYSKNGDVSSRSKTGSDDELTYSEFSVTTANSSVISSQLATSKFKTFKSKIQQMISSSQIDLFSRIALLTFFLLLGIASGNFAINLVKNSSFMKNLDVLTNLQVLLQQVPDSSHASRQLVLIQNNLVKIEDDVLEGYRDSFPSKYTFYADSLSRASTLFEKIQNHLQTDLKDLISLDKYMIRVKDVKTDGDIKEMTQSLQTSLNLFSSKILKLSSYNNGDKGGLGIPKGITVPKISFWYNETAQKGAAINNIQQDLYFIIENGLDSIVEGIQKIRDNTEDNIGQSSKSGGNISIILACISILLVIILLPASYKPLTHVETISQLILMALNRLPENFCRNETKACMEIIIFLSEQKEGEKSTHEMIKKHDHRKHNRQLLKLPRSQKTGKFNYQDSLYSSNLESESSDPEKTSLVKKSGLARGNTNKSTDSQASSAGAQSSRVTQLSKVRAEQHYDVQRIQRNEIGNIELDPSHAKSSDVQDDNTKEEEQLLEGRELTEEEQKQFDREAERTEAIEQNFKTQRIKKFLWLLLTAFIISIYYAVTCFYLSLIHNYELIYLNQYSLIGRRIQCYTNVVSYLTDTLSRNSNISLPGHPSEENAAWAYLQDCYKNEEDYKLMLLDGLTKYSLLDTFNDIDSNLDHQTICKTLSELSDVDGLKERNITQADCEKVYEGILINGGLTEALFHFLRGVQEVLLKFEDRGSNRPSLEVSKDLLKLNETNEMITLNQIYMRSAFEFLRIQTLSTTQNYFKKLNAYYNMLFGLFVGLLTVFQIIVALFMVKKLSQQIVKMYHVVLLIPFSGRTQNDLNELMLIQM